MGPLGRFTLMTGLAVLAVLAGVTTAQAQVLRPATQAGFERLVALLAADADLAAVARPGDVHIGANSATIDFDGDRQARYHAVLRHAGAPAWFQVVVTPAQPRIDTAIRRALPGAFATDPWSRPERSPPTVVTVAEPAVAREPVWRATSLPWALAKAGAALLLAALASLRWLHVPRGKS